MIEGGMSVLLLSRRRRQRYLLLFLTLSVLLAVSSIIIAVASQKIIAVRAESDENTYQHFFIIMMENTGYEHLIGNEHAPWINAAAKAYGLARNYFGVAHPSQPNYIAITAGTTAGFASDANMTIDVPNIVDQLEAHGKTWKAYMQSLFADGNTNKLAGSVGNQLYERKHNPFVSYKDIQDNPTRMENIVDLSQLYTDLANNTVPDYVWISPDQCHDMHGRFSLQPTDMCSFFHEDDLITAGDAFLRDTVTKIMASRAWKGKSVIFITWDESDLPFLDMSGCCDATPGGGHVVTLVISHTSHLARISSVNYNHYSLLATIEDGWNLGCLANTCDTAKVTPMSDLTGP
jgi:phosphatidylinositol-3-phosphatase